jgi:cell division protein FtsB
VRRTSFVLLLLGLLGGGLVCLLVVNTTLAANSIEIIRLQNRNAARSEQVQELQQQVAAARSATTIAKEARRLGMRPDPDLIFINLRTKSIEAPRGAAAAALAATLAAGAKPPANKPASGRPGQ